MQQHRNTTQPVNLKRTESLENLLTLVLKRVYMVERANLELIIVNVNVVRLVHMRQV